MATFLVIVIFIIKHAISAELWTMMESLHDVWLLSDGRVWLEHHLLSHKYIIAAIILQFQQVAGLYLKVANSLVYCQAVKASKQIDPHIYQEAFRWARHIISSMNNLIPGMTLRIFVIEPVDCHLFCANDWDIKDRSRADKKAKDMEEALCNDGPNKGHLGGGWRNERRAPHNNNSAPGAPPEDIPAAPVDILKAAGLFMDILELNGPSASPGYA
jgi:hypothetical protein